MFLLVVEDDDEDTPVSLDEVARDLEAEGFTVERISKDGETRLIKVDLDSAETLVKVDEQSRNTIEEIVKSGGTTEEPAIEQDGKLMKMRRKRNACLSCKLAELKMKKFHQGGGGCDGGCGGGNYYQQRKAEDDCVAARYD